MKIFVHNIRGLNQLKKRKLLYDYVRRINPEIFGILETKINRSKIQNWEPIAENYIVKEARTNRSALGMMIAYRKSTFYNKKIKCGTINERAMYLKVDINEKELLILLVHVPINLAHKLYFFGNIEEFIMNNNVTNFMIIGDFNFGENINKSYIEGFKQRFQIKDIAEEGGNRLMHTRYDKYSSSRLDRVYRSKECALQIKLEIDVVSYSDHAVLLIEIGSNKSKIGREKANKCNNYTEKVYIPALTMLTYDKKKEIVNKAATVGESLTLINADVKWALYKRVLISKLKDEIIEKEKSIKMTMQFWRKILEINLNEDKQNFRAIEIAKKNIFKMEMLKIDKIKEKVKNEVYTSTNNVNILISICKKRKINNTIQTYLSGINGEKYNKMGDILYAYKEDFIRSIEEKRNSVRFSEFFNTKTMFIKSRIPLEMNSKDRESYDNKFMMNELEDALKKINKKATPGPDGMSTELMQYSSKEIKIQLLKYFNSLDVEENARMLYNTNRADLVLVPKVEQNGQPLCFNNIRPLAMMNTDIKLLSLMVLDRIKGGLLKIIHPSVVSIGGRGISEAILKHIIAFSPSNNNKKCKNRNKLIVCIDMSNAFSRVGIDFLEKEIKTMFGINFTTKILVNIMKYKSIYFRQGKIRTNYVNCNNGILQGSPLSMAMFAVYMNRLAYVINAYIGDRFLVSNLMKYNTIIYADDLTVILNRRSDFQRLMTILEEFQVISNAKVNIEKSWVYDLDKRTRIDTILKGQMGLILGFDFISQIELASRRKESQLLEKANEKLKRYEAELVL